MDVVDGGGDDVTGFVGAGEGECVDLSGGVTGSGGAGVFCDGT